MTTGGGQGPPPGAARRPRGIAPAWLGMSLE